jgi:HSP20 family protein
MILMRFDPFPELDHRTEQAPVGSRSTRAMPMEAPCRADRFWVALDLPGVALEDIDVTEERNVVTVLAGPGLARP